MNTLKNLEATLAKQDRQIKEIQNAEARYKSDGNIESLIRFWEDLWENGGLTFNGSKWTFRLPDLYIKQKQYDEAIRALKKIKNPIYKEKKESYLEKTKSLKGKSKKK